MRSLYLDPLVRILEQQNGKNTQTEKRGVYAANKDTTLALLIDIKDNTTATLPVLQAQLKPLLDDGWLSFATTREFAPRPITIVASGNTPFDLVLGNPSPHDSIQRAIFFDAHLRDLIASPLVLSPYNSRNSYYASVPFDQAIGKSWVGKVSKDQVKTVEEQTKKAKEMGLKARYYSTKS